MRSTGQSTTDSWRDFELFFKVTNETIMVYIQFHKKIQEAVELNQALSFAAEVNQCLQNGQIVHTSEHSLQYEWTENFTVLDKI
jgi:hypothetical protein